MPNSVVKYGYSSFENVKVPVALSNTTIYIDGYAFKNVPFYSNSNNPARPMLTLPSTLQHFYSIGMKTDVNVEFDFSKAVNLKRISDECFDAKGYPRSKIVGGISLNSKIENFSFEFLRSANIELFMIGKGIDGIDLFSKIGYKNLEDYCRKLVGSLGQETVTLPWSYEPQVKEHADFFKNITVGYW